jgi:hypothetical protein
MIESIKTRGLWAESLTEAIVSHSLTVYVGDPDAALRPKVTAEINLSRLEGSGTAKADIAFYEWQGRLDNGSHSAGWLEDTAATQVALLGSPSSITFNDAISVTFRVTVKNMFAYANCSIFIYERPSVIDLLFTPIRRLFTRLGP